MKKMQAGADSWASEKHGGRKQEELRGRLGGLVDFELACRDAIGEHDHTVDHLLGRHNNFW